MMPCREGEKRTEKMIENIFMDAIIYVFAYTINISYPEMLENGSGCRTVFSYAQFKMRGSETEFMPVS